MSLFRRSNKNPPPQHPFQHHAPGRATGSVSESLQQLAGGADRFAVIDCETTGLTNHDRIIEIAVVTLNLLGQATERWETLVQPNRDPGPTQIHGITSRLLRGAPTFAEVTGDLGHRLHGACLVGHNVSFDLRFLRREYELQGIRLSTNGEVDTLRATRQKLALACRSNDITLVGAHRALIDAEATGRLMLAVQDRCYQGGPAHLSSLPAPSGRVKVRSTYEPVGQKWAPPPPDTLVASSQTGSPAQIAYLDLVDKAIEDLHIDLTESHQMSEMADRLRLTEAEIQEAHVSYVEELLSYALANEVLSLDHVEYLHRIAAPLGVEPAIINTKTARARAYRSEMRLEAGMAVAFTGDDTTCSRDDLEQMAVDRGLMIVPRVTKKSTFLVASDPLGNSAKTRTARRYNQPIMSVADFLAAKQGEMAACTRFRSAVRAVLCPVCNRTTIVPSSQTGQKRKTCERCSDNKRNRSRRQPS